MKVHGSSVSPRSTLAIGSIAGVTLMSMEHVGFLWHRDDKKSGVGLAKKSLEEILSAKGRTSLKDMKNKETQMLSLMLSLLFA